MPLFDYMNNFTVDVIPKNPFIFHMKLAHSPAMEVSTLAHALLNIAIGLFQLYGSADLPPLEYAFELSTQWEKQLSFSMW